MARHVGGARVEGGFYWCPRGLEIQVVGEGGGVLPGDGRAVYVKVPFPVLAVVVPLAGALFLVSLPLVGLALVGGALLRRAFGGAREAAADLAGTVAPAWRPGEAHLTGEPRDPGAAPVAPAAPDAKLDALEREISGRKGAKGT
jgi:hypothetical protein